MKIYVAGAWIEKAERAEVAIKRLQEAGFTITHDWTKDEQTWSNEKSSDKNMPPEERKRRAFSDIVGVRNADIVWLLAPKERGSSGAWTEFGAALALNKVTVVSGTNCRRTIFTELATKLFESDEDAFEWLKASKERDVPLTYLKNSESQPIQNFGSDGQPVDDRPYGKVP